MERRKLAPHVITLAIFGAVALVVLIALFRLSGFLSFGSTYRVKAIVPQAGSLTEGTSVTMAGARVGTVQKVSRRGVGALVDIRIDDKSVVPLPKDSTAELSVRTPLGENYVELLPGKSKDELPDGGLVPSNPGYEYVDVDQILSVLQGKTRDRAREVIQGLGDAVGNRGPQLATTLGSTSGVLEAGSSLTSRLVGDRDEIGRLVRQLGDLSQSVGERGESIRQLARQGLTTFDAIADRDARVRELIGVLPATLRQVRKTTGTLQATSLIATPVVANLATAMREVRPAVRQLAPAATEGQGVVSQLSRAAKPLEGTLASVRSAGPDIADVMPKLNKVMCQLNPVLRYVKPYTPDIVSFANSLGSAANSYDAIGHTIRLMPVINETALLGAPKAVNDAAAVLLHTGLAEKATGMSFEPFPKPGQAETAFKPGDKIVKGPQEYREKGGTYTRVTADC